MNIAVIYNSGIQVSWDHSEGIVNTLRHMGHAVLDLPQSPHKRNSTNWWDHLDNINNADLMIMSGPEYACYAPFYCGYHPKGGYDREFVIMQFKRICGLKPKKVALYQESMDRRDGVAYAFDWLATGAPFFDHHFYPAKQDYEKFSDIHKLGPARAHWLPFSADTYMFYPYESASRDIEFGFLGSRYPVRQQFIDELGKLGTPELITGNSLVEDIDGHNAYENVKRLTHNYNRIKTLVCLPSMSRLFPSKVSEAMACGCGVLVSAMDAENSPIADTGRGITYYENTPRDLHGLMKILHESPSMTNQMGWEALDTVKKELNLWKKLQEMLDISVV